MTRCSCLHNKLLPTHRRIAQDRPTSKQALPRMRADITIAQEEF